MVYGKDWLLEAVPVTHWMILDRFLYLFQFINQVTVLNHTISQAPSSSGFLLRLTLQFCKDRNFTIIVHFFSPSYVLKRMFLLFSAQENEKLDLTSPFFNRMKHWRTGKSDCLGKLRNKFSILAPDWPIQKSMGTFTLCSLHVANSEK